MKVDMTLNRETYIVVTDRAHGKGSILTEVVMGDVINYTAAH